MTLPFLAMGSIPADVFPYRGRRHIKGLSRTQNLLSFHYHTVSGFETVEDFSILCVDGTNLDASNLCFRALSHANYSVRFIAAHLLQ